MAWPLLSEEQQELLFRLVELDRDAKARRQDRMILATATFGGASVQVGGVELEVDYADAVELLNRGFLSPLRVDESYFTARVSPEAVEYYRDRKAATTPVEELAAEVPKLVDRSLPHEFRTALTLLEEAGKIIWVAEDSRSYTTVGHKMREALQEFSEILYVQHCRAAGPIERNKTRNKVAAFAAAVGPHVGGADRKLLDAVVALWDAVDELAQKMEHGSRREDRPLTVADAKRLVLLAFLTMQELARLTALLPPSR